jgi:hypothetical protein
LGFLDYISGAISNLTLLCGKAKMVIKATGDFLPREVKQMISACSRR